METRLRQTAFKVRVSDVLNGRYFVQEGWEPNYIIVEGDKVSRVNIIGVIVSKQSSELGKNEVMVMDDGSGRISLRSFEDADFSRVKVGDVVVLIGRPREYSGEIYIMPEIIHPLENKGWGDVRKIELGLHKAQNADSPILQEPKPENTKKDDKIERFETEEILYDKDEGSAESEASIGKTESIAEKIIKNIKKLDEGDGADIDEVIKTHGSEAEDAINELMRRGDIFELRPGRVKVLE